MQIQTSCDIQAAGKQNITNKVNISFHNKSDQEETKDDESFET